MEPVTDHALKCCSVYQMKNLKNDIQNTSSTVCLWEMYGTSCNTSSFFNTLCCIKAVMEAESSTAATSRKGIPTNQSITYTYFDVRFGQQCILL